jgi:hypothetical protein
LAATTSEASVGYYNKASAATTSEAPVGYYNKAFGSYNK